MRRFKPQQTKLHCTRVWQSLGWVCLTSGKDLSPSGSDHCDLLTRTAKTLLWGLIWFLSFDDDNDGELVWNFNVTKFIKSCFSATTLNPGHANPSQ